MENVKLVRTEYGKRSIHDRRKKVDWYLYSYHVRGEEFRTSIEVTCGTSADTALHFLEQKLSKRKTITI